MKSPLQSVPAIFVSHVASSDLIVPQISRTLPAISESPVSLASWVSVCSIVKTTEQASSRVIVDPSSDNSSDAERMLKINPIAPIRATVHNPSVTILESIILAKGRFAR